jgi:hypothetical protein
MIELFLDADESDYPNIARTVEALAEQARNLQCGGSPYFPAPEFLNLWWPRDQYVMLRLIRDEHLGQFYDEAEELLTRCLPSGDTSIDPFLIKDAVRLNRAMFVLPFQWHDETLSLSYPIASAYRSILGGRKPDLSRRSETVTVERTRKVWLKWEDWYEELLRRIYLRKNYLYPIHIVDTMKSPVRTGAKPEMLPEG